MDYRFLSRGKAKDSGEWAVGLLTYISKSSAEITDVITNENFWVDAETLGGCTGLTSKNGKLIFEGDRVSVPMHGAGNKITYRTGIVEWRKGTFAVKWDDALYGRHFVGYLEGAEVIGNIHDNPDMPSRADTPVSDDVSQPVLAPAMPENFEIFPT